MIKHVYLLKLKDPSKAPEVAAKVRTMKDRIPTVMDIEVGIDFKGTPTSYDVCEIATFKDEADFEAFGKHPYHQEIRDYIQDIKESVAKSDYRV